MFERFTDRARRVVVLAQEEARMLNHNYIGTEHILLGLIHEGEGAPGGQGEGPQGSMVLDQFGRNLTQLAREQKLDPVIGREKEIERVMQVLSRRTKNNPVLIGEPEH